MKMSSSVYSDLKNQFFSHPVNEKKHSLSDHSIRVADKTEELFKTTGFYLKNFGFYAGLLHDIGKLNPYYQELFILADHNLRRLKQDELSSVYENKHSPLSSWAAIKLLDEKLSGVDYNIIDKIIMVIYGHHSKLLNSVPNDSSYYSLARFKKSQLKMNEVLKDFHEHVTSMKEFSKLDWNKCLNRFCNPVSFEIRLKSNSDRYIFDFLQISYLFSSLLQADRGSFNDWVTSKFDVELDTNNLIKRTSELSNLRNKFQEEVQLNHDLGVDVCILEAPTGIGKTKVFLDLIQKYKQSKENIQRVFYFSPLLALTEDFEKKIEMTIKSTKDDVLVYNHLFSGNLAEKDRKESGLYEEQHWFFPYESFNMKFIITTTQRLLITLYSNSAGDKLKLASFNNSILIIDEIQTIPKFILPNLSDLLIEIAKKTNSKIIFVSATVPYELNSIQKIPLSHELKTNYLEKTLKKITFSQCLSIPSIQNKKILIMLNTRRKATGVFKNLSLFIQNNISIITGDSANVFYLSSGIRKKDRIRIIDEIGKVGTPEGKFKDCLVVSTQVVEAGVDISFSEIYREIAPIDSVIQVMGRLNREGTDDSALLSIFQIDKDHRPYNELEYNESLSILKNIKSSHELYNNLDLYYKTINMKHKLNEKKSQELKNYMIDLDFNKIWEFVNNNVMPDDGISVFIPENLVQWNEIKTEFSKEKVSRGAYKKFIELTASLPQSVSLGEFNEFCDPVLLEKHILLPKFELLDEVYDKKVGLDKWLPELKFHLLPSQEVYDKKVGLDKWLLEK